MTRRNMWWRVGIVALFFGLVAWRLTREEALPYSELQYQLSPSVQKILDTAFARYDYPKPVPEYAYCIANYRIRMQADSVPVLLVDSIVPAIPDQATPSSIEYSCGPFPALHSHPPTDCQQNEDGKWGCSLVEDTTDLCEPSYPDVASTLTDWHRFHGIQCGRRRFLFFVPDFLDS